MSPELCLAPDDPRTAEEDRERRSRSRGAVVISLLLALVGAVAAVAIRREAATIAAICAGSSALHFAAALGAYRTRRYAVPGALIALNLLVAIALTNLLSQEGPSDAFNSQSVLFFVILPQLTMYLVGVRGSIAMGIAATAYFAAIFAWLVVRPPSAPDPDLKAKYIAINVAILVGFAMSLLYARAQTRMMAELRAAHRTLDSARIADQQRLREEIDLAARIQTALLPRDLRVEGLEISAAMRPAAEVGGDYYDVIPVEDGAWLCIGDVAGHGLNAGLAMLMMQSAVSALAQKHPSPRPDRVLCAINATLYENIRRRMGRDEHATLTLLRYHRDGTVCFAGAHEEILVLRAAEGRCEAVATPGPWVGARPSIAGQVPQGRLALADGDLFVLYTDGLTEARDGGRREFGRERIEAAILGARGRPVEAIREAILGAVHAFSPVLADDVTLMVARYRAPACGVSSMTALPMPSAATSAHETLETRARSRIVAGVGLLLSLVTALNVFLLYPRYRALAVLCMVVCPIHLAAATLAHRTRRYVVPGALIGVTFSLGTAASGLLQSEVSGVFVAINLLFPTLIPQIATLLLGARSGIAMGVTTIVYLSAVFAWLLLHPEGAGDPLLTLHYIVADLAIVVGLALSVLYTRLRAGTVAELRRAHTALDAVRIVEQRRLREEIDLAAHIQTALLPRDLRVEGLEIAAAMLPAAEVGGDYYDVIPVEGGAWLCIGDVAGHGLNAGLTMLMIQSTVSALAQDDPAQGPEEALCALNATLYQNVRQRMGRDEHATVTLLRYQRDGTVCFAGAHEEILVLRAAAGRCEAITTPGPWVGTRPSIAGQVPRSRLTLCDGDVLVLYTDGLTEARDGEQRQFGLERVEAEILRARGEPVDVIREAILAAVHAFSPVLADDVALVIARYHAPA